MSNKIIAVPFNMFTLEQQILLYDEDNGTTEFARVELAKLPEVVADLAYAQHIDTIKLAGNKSYVTALETEIKNYVVSNYAQYELNIEILEA